jgi:hypothetical protein
MPHGGTGLLVVLLAGSASAQFSPPPSSQAGAFSSFRSAGPYLSTTPTVIVNVPPPTSMAASFYMPMTAPAFPPPFYPPFGYPFYLPPVAANLQGLASLTSATGQYWQDIQRARILREQSRQAALDTRRRQVEFELWYEGIRPTAPQLAAARRESELHWARYDAQSTQIWTGRPLNVLLQSILRAPQPTRGPHIPLDQDTLKGLNLTDSRTSGSLALAKDGGAIAWTETLQGASFDEVRERFGKAFAKAVREAQKGILPPPSLIRDLQADLQSLDSMLNAQVQTLTPDSFISSRRLLNQLRENVRGLGNARLVKSHDNSWRKTIHTVADLVGHLQATGMQFGPAMAPGDFPRYIAAYFAIRNYERGIWQVAAG